MAPGDYIESIGTMLLVAIPIHCMLGICRVFVGKNSPNALYSTSTPPFGRVDSTVFDC